MKNLNFIFFGRLEKEKGFNLLLDLIQLSITQKNNHNFYIFGTGKLEQKIYSKLIQANLVNLKLATNQEVLDFIPTQNQIIFCGQRDYSEVIEPILKDKINYSLIPSLLLETFGYSALESLKNEVPIISTSIGGLQQFTLSEHIIEPTLKSFFNKIQTLQKPSEEQIKKIQLIADIYTSKNWVNQINKIIPTNQKILIVSDFKQEIGGTEKHIHQIKTILETKGNQVQIFGSQSKPSMINLIKSICNKKENLLLNNQINKFNPTIIWCHSVMRLLGPLCLQTINQTKTTKIITIHDFGLFTDYPSKLNNIQQLNSTPKSLFAKLKYLFLQKRIQQQIKLFDLIFVPSKFMQKPIETILNKKVTILPHFIDNTND